MSETGKKLLEEWKAIDHAIVRLRISVLATVFGLLGGLGLFAATLWLVILGKIQGSTVVGPTLGLLRFYFPGYEVTVPGSFLGLFYGTISGAAVGFVVALVYNLVADRRRNRPD